MRRRGYTIGFDRLLHLVHPEPTAGFFLRMRFAKHHWDDAEPTVVELAKSWPEPSQSAVCPVATTPRSARCQHRRSTVAATSLGQMDHPASWWRRERSSSKMASRSMSLTGSSHDGDRIELVRPQRVMSPTSYLAALAPCPIKKMSAASPSMSNSLLHRSRKVRFRGNVVPRPWSAKTLRNSRSSKCPCTFDFEQVADRDRPASRDCVAAGDSKSATHDTQGMPNENPEAGRNVVAEELLPARRLSFNGQIAALTILILDRLRHAPLDADLGTGTLMHIISERIPRSNCIGSAKAGRSSEYVEPPPIHGYACFDQSTSGQLNRLRQDVHHDPWRGGSSPMSNVAGWWCHRR